MAEACTDVGGDASRLVESVVDEWMDGPRAWKGSRMSGLVVW